MIPTSWGGNASRFGGFKIVARRFGGVYSKITGGAVLTPWTIIPAEV